MLDGFQYIYCLNVVFALNHYNYARWVSAHLFDFVNLQLSHPDVYENFMNGFFTFNKSCSEFSNMALDQIHEQNNDLIKGVGGATHLINREDDSALLRWEICGSELAGMISSFEDEVSVSNDKAANYGKHHEDTVFSQ